MQAICQRRRPAWLLPFLRLASSAAAKAAPAHGSAITANPTGGVSTNARFPISSRHT